MFPASMAGYDRAITIFSPEGRLLQVEYAVEAVRKGFTTIGIRCVDGVVLVAERRKMPKLLDEKTLEKIWKIDDHIGMAYAGLSPDARVLMEEARRLAQVHRILYDEPIPVETLAIRIGDIKQFYTLHAGARPFGVSFLIGGVDNKKPSLMWTDPGGAYAGYYAHALGAGSQKAQEILEREYRKDITLEEGIRLGLEIMAEIVEGELTPSKLELAVIPVETALFYKYSAKEIEELIGKYGLKR